MSQAVSRRGAALLVTLVFATLLGWLSLALHHVSLGAHRRSAARRDVVVATAGATAGLWGVLRDARVHAFDTLHVGDPPVVVRRAAGSALVEVRAVRISPVTWQLVATAWFPDTVLARRTVRQATMVVRQDLPDIGGLAALTVRDAVGVVGSGEVIGTDTTSSPLLAGCLPGTGVAGVAMPDTLRRTGTGRIVGVPPLIEDATAGTMAPYNGYGSESWGTLTARAQLRLAAGAVITPGPVTAFAACDTTVVSNWGEPSGTGPCARHAPLILARGSVELRGGRGQGMLLVDGDLTVSGGARFDGIVIVRDDVRTGPGGGVLRGAVLAADTAAAPGDHPEVGDGLRVERAGCLVAGVLSRQARWRPVHGRAWLPM